jgi:hypothetical protein
LNSRRILTAAFSFSSQGSFANCGENLGKTVALPEPIF